jgi:hypothetical protein
MMQMTMENSTLCRVVCTALVSKRPYDQFCRAYEAGPTNTVTSQPIRA